ncbi:glycoside hydrolase family 95 protein-like protein [Pseudovirgaria hyperparasitica]|uniref:Glycoside hydrolase family 95 protein-like protein n=1 Tax=Pseudovirgaria hyperparasitica TaxID=470096 RepID=A0A6A6W696_9PEZI|nr:glycoside hydrolase family 95 protein-like protein [Pseudovirgaria hyperparasitica]KAF2756591.1 glycoside hydrolase family 95 protein-like protein [Pseudovirgaria hyperparasitica]
MLLPRYIAFFLINFVIRCEAKTLWSYSPASSEDIIRTAYPVGNGVLGAMAFGPAGAEKLVLNIDSLWSGGPFENSSYRGGNPSSPVSSSLDGIRDWIFQNGTGNVSQLLGSNEMYGSYRVLGNFSIEIAGVSDATSSYHRQLDLKNGLHATTFLADGASFSTTAYCSFPDQVCVYDVTSDHDLPSITVWLENQKVDSALNKQSCGNAYVRMRGVTQIGPPLGMRYDAIARAIGDANSSCDPDTGYLTLHPSIGSKQATFVVGADTDFDQEKGTSVFGYSFRGANPGYSVRRLTDTAARKTAATLLEAHIGDYQNLAGRFVLDLPDPLESAALETSELFERYSSSNTTGDPFLESLLFDFSRHLFISASRENSLPPNLQGRWSEELGAAWSGDYHSNINLQMNHWNADQTGLGELQAALWNYMEQNWVPRGTQTAKLLYGAPGWVVHDEMNIFGHTGMKSDAQWANYPIAAAWMMQHVWDNFEYSSDISWLRDQGYPLLKGVAQFWLSQLMKDKYTNDNTIVVAPCNSAEHGPTTFGCAHYQQLIYQVFESILSSNALIGDTDTSFITNVSRTLEKLDKGIHIGSFNQIKEWKLPDSYGYDFPNDTHRHLSDLVGWYPGYSISSYENAYTNSTLQEAVTTKLYSRGNGNAADGNAAWAKVWRSACWGRLNNTERAYYELKYAIEQNFAPNGLSMYSGRYPPFQIDANYGLGGAVLSMLMVDLPQRHGELGVRTVVLGPAIPVSWVGGSVKGLRLRGGGQVDFDWDNEGIVRSAVVTGREKPLRVVNKIGDVVVA